MQVKAMTAVLAPHRATAGRPRVLFDLATARLIEAKMLSWLTARAVGVAFLR